MSVLSPRRTDEEAGFRRNRSLRSCREWDAGGKVADLVRRNGVTRESPAIEVDTSLPGERVVRVPDALADTGASSDPLSCLR